MDRWKFVRMAEFAPEDCELWRESSGVLGSLGAGEWVAGVVRVRHGVIKIEAPVTGGEKSVVVLAEWVATSSTVARLEGSLLVQSVVGEPYDGAALIEDGADGAARPLYVRFAYREPRDEFLGAVRGCVACSIAEIPFPLAPYSPQEASRGWHRDAPAAMASTSRA